MTQLANQLRAEVPEHGEARTRVKVIPFQRDVVKGHSSGLWMLLAAVLVLLAIACANVALLMLGRATGRERELLVRVAMGGTRARIARLAFSECLIVAVIGGGLGLLLARASVSLLGARALADLPRLQEISVDNGVALFAVAVTTLSAVLFGLLPALSAARVDVAGGLRAGNTIGTHGRGRHFREGLVVAQTRARPGAGDRRWPRRAEFPHAGVVQSGLQRRRRGDDASRHARTSVCRPSRSRFVSRDAGGADPRGPRRLPRRRDFVAAAVGPGTTAAIRVR